jgi:hypothetical protein
MSQEIKTKSVRIKNINALERAVAKARERGHNVELVKNGLVRLWAGSTKRCDWVIKLHDKNFDVGLERTKSKEVEYELCFDDWSGEVFSVLGKEIEGIEHGPGHVKNKTGFKYTTEELTLSNVNQVVTDYYKEAFAQEAQSHGYTMETSTETEKGCVMEYAV